MILQYIGAGEDSPEVTRPFGVEFRLGDPVEVEDGSLAAVKLAHNPAFRVITAPEDPAPEDEPAETDYRAALEAAGVKVDGRWGEARLRQEFESIG